MSETRLIHTTCNRDCPDACGIVGHVRDGRVVRLQGDPKHPVTKGFLCFRTDQFLSRQYSPSRVVTPLVRRDGALVRASWDEALDLCARELLRIRSESGPEAIFHYRSGGSLGLVKHLCDDFWARFGPVTSKRGDICGGGGDAAQLTDFGDSDSNDLSDLAHARAVILWGKNPHTSSPHLLPVLQDLKKRGVSIALIDPVAHRGTSLASLHVQPRPGGDLALALCLAAMAFDYGRVSPDAGSFCDNLDGFHRLACSKTATEWALDAGVEVSQIEALFNFYTARSPAAILVGWGMQRRTNGGAIVRALDALGAVTGNVGVSGGGVSFYFKRRGSFDFSMLRTDAPRTVCEPLFGHDILAARSPEIRAVWITAGNPVTMLPDSWSTVKALKTREFVVVVDSLMTDTAKLATVVLPTTTLLEDDDVAGAYGHHWIGEVRPVVPPPPEVLTDYEIVQKLAARVGLGARYADDVRVWKQRLLGKTPLDALREGPVRSRASGRIAFEGRRFATPTGKANLMTELPTEPARSSDFPLVLQALSTPQSQSSQWSPQEPEERLWAKVHPDSAAGLSDGATARVRSVLGALTVTVKLDPTLRRGVVVVPKGGSLAYGRCANAITQAVLTDIGEGAALYEEPVALEAV